MTVWLSPIDMAVWLVRGISSASPAVFSVVESGVLLTDAQPSPGACVTATPPACSQWHSFYVDRMHTRDGGGRRAGTRSMFRCKRATALFFVSPPLSLRTFSTWNSVICRYLLPTVSRGSRRRCSAPSACIQGGGPPHTRR